MEFDRFKLLVGEKYLKVKNLKILIVGVGGVGGYVLESLVRNGVSDITIVDGDVVDITNINRQIIALNSTIGRKKVDVWKERILDINPSCKVETYDNFYNIETSSHILNKEYDYIIDCCDDLKNKELLIREAITKNIKIISSMGAGFKLEPDKIKISKLKNTDYDKIAKVLRYKLKDNKKGLEIPVVYSTEQKIINNKTIASNSYIPAIFGLYITAYIIKEIMEEK